MPKPRPRIGSSADDEHHGAKRILKVRRVDPFRFVIGRRFVFDVSDHADYFAFGSADRNLLANWIRVREIAAREVVVDDPDRRGFPGIVFAEGAASDERD